MITTSEYQAAGAMVSGWQRVGLMTHERPDGDALGSLVALQRSLSQQGREVHAWVFGEVPSRYQSLAELAPLGSWSTGAVAECDRMEGVIIVDTCAYAQLLPAAEWLRQRRCPVIVVDHHVTRDSLADYLLADESASAAALLVAEWLTACGWPIDRETASALFVGVAMDTGWFRFSNTDPRTFRQAAALQEQGVEAARWYQRLYQSDSPGRLRLIGAVLERMELESSGRLAILTIPAGLIEAVGATNDDVEDIINEVQRLGSVDTALLLQEMAGGVVKISLRSKQSVDVAAVARTLGGGGHQRAAGARYTGELVQVRGMLVEQLRHLL
ncbi:MAG: Bifunctional oligoribonuclease and PAP phosphatase NrnA [Phycisphaerae bacterium]|nr:Bifunctional oligoribonuclease and PAP phosphatase NrnA [Phycisphaerae bacterium]